MQLSRGIATVAVVVLVGAAGVARADNELTARTAYYKERGTRVVQPMVDASLDLGDKATADGHFLVDAITSASMASGTTGGGFTERRYEAGGGYTRMYGLLTLGANAKYSSEPDYKSAYGGLRGQIDLFQHNFTLAAGGGYAHDNTSNGNVAGTTPLIEDTLGTTYGSLVATQLLGENSLIGVGYDVSHLVGCQQNLYRTVIAGDMIFPEHHPRRRTRQAVSATYKRYFERTSTTLIATYRYYTDDWGIRASTPELRVIQDAGDDVTFGFRYRYHHQTKADFFQEHYLEQELYLSADQKLSAFDSHTLGARFEVLGAAVGFHDYLGAVRGTLTIEYAVQGNSFGNAGEAQAALTFPLE